ncbi:hypothetical protein CR513_28392, partial [Mucuna pruriens]
MRVVAQALQAQAFRKNDGGGNKNKKGKWKNKLKDSSEGSKISNHNSGGNNYKKNEVHEKFSKKVGNQNRGGQRKFVKGIYSVVHEDKPQMTQGNNDDSDSNHILLMATTSDCAKSDVWNLDVGCSNHMTGNKGWFVNLDEKVKRMMKFANNSTITVERMGKVLIQRRDGQQLFIIDVLYVP